MIESYVVGARFVVVNEASSTLERIAKQVQALAGETAKAREGLLKLGSPLPAIGTFSKLETQFKALADQAAATRRVITGEFNKPMSVGGMQTGLDALKAQFGQIADASKAAAADISSSLNAAVFEPANMASGIIKSNFEAAALAARSLAGGGGGGGGRGAPPSIRRRGAGGGGGHGGMRFGGYNAHLPGSSVHVGGNAALAAGGMLAFGAYEEAEMEDAQFQLIYHSGQRNTPENRSRFRKTIQNSMSESGYGLRETVEAAKTEIRMFKGTPGGGIDVLPEMLRAATIEARLKGTSVEESMNSLVGLAHMSKEYDPEQIKKLTPAFAFLSASNPSSLSSMERAAGYAVPILQSDLGVDPMSTLLMGMVLTRAGITNTKSGTWIRSMMTNALPGTSTMSKEAYKKHEESLKRLGLVDDQDQPTWFTDGKPDAFKLLDIGSEHAAGLSMVDRNAAEKALFGVQGQGAFSVLSDPAVRGQVQALKAEMNGDEFKNRYAAFNDEYSENSPVQKARQTWADLQNVLMDIGEHALPPVVVGLKAFDAVLKGMENTIGSTGTSAVVGIALGSVVAGWARSKVGGLFGGLLGAGAGAAGGASVTGEAAVAATAFGTAAAAAFGAALVAGGAGLLKNYFDNKTDPGHKRSLSTLPDGTVLSPDGEVLPIVPQSFGGGGLAGLIHKAAFTTGAGGAGGGVEDIFNAGTQQGVLDGLIAVAGSARQIIASWFSGMAPNGAPYGLGGVGGSIYRASLETGGFEGDGFSDDGGGGGGGGGGFVAPHRRAGGARGGARAGRGGGGGARIAAGAFGPGSPGAATAASVITRMMHDYGLTRAQATGAAGWMGYESGNFRTMQEVGHSGWGYAQWTGPRRHAFMNYAQTNHLDPSSDAANYGFMQSELASNDFAQVIPALRRAGTVDEANRVWGHLYEGMREGGPGVPAFAGHAAVARRYMNIPLGTAAAVDSPAEFERERRRAQALSNIHSPVASGGQVVQVNHQTMLDGRVLAQNVSHHVVKSLTHPRGAPAHDPGHLYSSLDYGFATG